MERAIEQGYIVSLDDLIKANSNEQTTKSIRDATEESKDSKRVQRSNYANTEPQRFFHGTDKNIPIFKLKHEGRKDKGWLRGVYVSDDP